MWINKYGCRLANNCPKGFCAHIRGVASLDKEIFMRLLDRVNDRNAAEEITLEDIQDLRPPDYMNDITTLQTFRCTNNRSFSTPVDPDHHHQAIHNLWNLVKGNRRAPKMGTTSITPAATGAHPLSHSRTPEKPSPPPRSLVRKVTRTLKGPQDTNHNDLSTTRSPRAPRASRGHQASISHQASLYYPKCNARTLQTEDRLCWPQVYLFCFS